MVIKHFMVSATYVPSQDVLEQQATETANYSVLMELNNFSVCLSFIAHKLYCYCSFSGSKQAKSGATLSL